MDKGYLYKCCSDSVDPGHSNVTVKSLFKAAAIIRNLNFVTKKEIFDFVFRQKLSTWPTCIWYNWKGLEKTFSMIFMSLSYVVTKLWCFEIFFIIGKVRGWLLLEGRLLPCSAY